jgi:hypothetical protein
MDGAFERIKGVSFSILDHLKGLIVVVAAGFAGGHDTPPLT